MHHELQLPEDLEGRYVLAVCDTCKMEARANAPDDTIGIHVAFCRKCRAGMCDECVSCCGICDEYHCNKHLQTCLGCGERCCSECLFDARCGDCSKLSPEITESAERFLSGVIMCSWLAVSGFVVGYIIHLLNQ